MKLNDVTGRKSIYETEVAVKPATGAMEIAIDNKPAFTAKDQASADAIKNMVSTGAVTPVDPNKTPGAVEEGIFGTTEEELAKDPSTAGDYYRKLAALKNDPRWVGKQNVVQARIEDLLNRINDGKGIPQPGQGQPLGPELDPAKFQQKNPGFGEPGALQKGIDRIKSAFQEEHKDTIAQGGGDIGGDATDDFINDITDQKFTRAQRDGSGRQSKLSENDELMKWLTIAGIK
jgi:hypothetical protein